MGLNIGNLLENGLGSGDKIKCAETGLTGQVLKVETNPYGSADARIFGETVVYVNPPITFTKHHRGAEAINPALEKRSDFMIVNDTT